METWIKIKISGKNWLVVLEGTDEVIFNICIETLPPANMTVQRKVELS